MNKQTSATKQQADLFIQSNRFANARAIYQELCNNNHRDAEAWFILGSLDGRLGLFEESAKAYQHCLSLRADWPEAISGSAAALVQLRRYAEAEPLFRQALKLKPGLVNNYQGLATCLFEQGKLAEAQHASESSIKYMPTFIPAHLNLAEIHWRYGDVFKAFEILERAYAICPFDTNILKRIGQIAVYCGRLNDAVSYLKKALLKMPADAEAHYNLGFAYYILGELDDALYCYELAVLLNPDYTEPTAGIAQILSRKGKTSEATQLLEENINKIPYEIPITLTYGTVCLKAKRPEDAIPKILAILERPYITEEQKRSAHYVLGNLFDNVGDYDKAFQSFKKANDMVPKLHNRKEVDAFVEELISKFNLPQLEPGNFASNPSEVPVFIVGMPRSGTTLVEQIISSHPDVHGAGELRDLHDLISTAFNPINPASQKILDLTNASFRNLPGAAKKYLEVLQQLAPHAPRVTDKMPSNFFYLGFIQLMFPNARIIHCVRNPVDTCLSCYFQDFGGKHSYSANLEHLTHYYNSYHRVMSHWKSIMSMPIFDVSYRNMVEDQETTIRQLIKFCGLEWNDQCLKFYKHKRVVTTASNEQVNRPIYTSSLDRWVKYAKHIGPLKSLQELDETL